MSNTNEDKKLEASNKKTKPKRPVKAAAQEKKANDGSRYRVNSQTLSLARGSLPELPPDSRFKRRWVNDYPGKLSAALSMGYDYMTDEDIKQSSNVNYQYDSVGTRICTIVDKTTGLKAYAMQTPIELYSKNKDKKLDKVRAINKAIYGREDYRGASVDPRAIDPNKDHLNPVFTGGDKVDVSLPRNK